MIGVFLFGALAAATIELQVQPVAGEAVSGHLSQLDSNQLVLTTDNGERTFAVDELFSAAPAAPAAGKPPAAEIWVELTDGSKLLATGYTVERGLAKVRLTSDDMVDVRTRSIQTVRFKSHQGEPALAEQWAKIVARPERSGDVVVVRRTVEKPIKADGADAVQKEHALDYVDGVLYNISAENIQFELDGDLIDVPRSRVEGVIYYHPRGDEPAEPVCRVTDVFGAVWSARSLTWRTDTGNLEVTTAAGVNVELAADELGRLDFSVGKLQYLSDLTPASVNFTPRQSGGASDPNYAKLFSFKRDRALLDDGPLLVDGQEYRKGLTMASRTEVTYVLPEGYRRFRALAAIDDRAGGRGNVELVITADGRELERRVVDGAAEPVRLDIDIAGVRRLTILADWGEYGDRNDDLNLCEARITK